MAKRIPAVGPTTPAGQELIERLFSILRVDLAVMYAIVFAMVVKPTTDDGWTIAIAAVVLVALTVLFLAPLRSKSGRPASSTATD
jgi:hypothetical protein